MDELLKMLFAFSWVWIPIVAILAGTFSEWLKFKEKQAQLGASTREIEGRLDTMKAELDAERARLQRRVEHLEAIVTSDTWDVIQARSASVEALPDGFEPPLSSTLLAMPPEEDNAERVAELARRVRG